MIATRSFVSAITRDQITHACDDAARGLEARSAIIVFKPAARARAGAIHVTTEPVEMLTLNSTRIASTYLLVKVAATSRLKDS